MQIKNVRDLALERSIAQWNRLKVLGISFDCEIFAQPSSSVCRRIYFCFEFLTRIQVMWVTVNGDRDTRRRRHPTGHRVGCRRPLRCSNSKCAENGCVWLMFRVAVAECIDSSALYNRVLSARKRIEIVEMREKNIGNGYALFCVGHISNCTFRKYARMEQWWSVVISD